MNKLVRYIHEHVARNSGRIEDKEAVHLWFQLGAPWRDRLVVSMYDLYVHGLAHDYTPMSMEAFLNWIDDLEAYQLVDEFTEHEIMELFCDE